MIVILFDAMIQLLLLLWLLYFFLFHFFEDLPAQLLQILHSSRISFFILLFQELSFKLVKRVLGPDKTITYGLDHTIWWAKNVLNKGVGVLFDLRLCFTAADSPYCRFFIIFLLMNILLLLRLDTAGDILARISFKFSSVDYTHLLLLLLDLLLIRIICCSII